MTTMNILSVAQTTDLINLIIQLRAKFNKSDDDTRIHTSFNILRWPQFLSVNLLPIEYKTQLATSIVDLGNHWTKFNNGTAFSKIYLEELDQLNRFGEFMTNPNNKEDYTSLRKQFVEFVDEYDRRKNTNFSQTFPHLQEFYDEWRKL
jgi:hypothetical protein